jgi:hypothetical protein
MTGERRPDAWIDADEEHTNAGTNPIAQRRQHRP